MYKYATGLPAHAAVIGLVNPLTVTIVRKGMADGHTHDKDRGANCTVPITPHIECHR